MFIYIFELLLNVISLKNYFLKVSTFLRLIFKVIDINPTFKITPEIPNNATAIISFEYKKNPTANTVALTMVVKIV